MNKYKMNKSQPNKVFQVRVRQKIHPKYNKLRQNKVKKNYKKRN